MVRLLISKGADPTISKYSGDGLINLCTSDRMKNFIGSLFSSVILENIFLNILLSIFKKCF